MKNSALDSQKLNAPNDTFNFDEVHNRRVYASTKWLKYGDRDVLPFWVADMDFRAPDFILEAVKSRLGHPVIGYTDLPDELISAFIDWADRRYGWRVHPDWLIAFTSLVPGLNAAVRSVGADGNSMLVMTPIYPPFLKTAEINRRRQIRSPLVLANGQWIMDIDDIERKTCDVATTILLLSNPQNPTGRVYTKEELRALGNVCVRNKTVIVSDEIHWGLCLDRNVNHIPLATLSDEFESNLITLISHTKSYNTAGLQSAFAVIRNPTLRARFEKATDGWMASVSPLAFAAAIAAYNDHSAWLPELQDYLRVNRDTLAHVVAALPNVSMAHVEGTHLGWLDARAIPVLDQAAYFEAHGLGLSDGVDFGAPGFVRFNFAAPRSIVENGVSRLQRASECAPTH